MIPYLKKLEEQIRLNGSITALADYGGKAYTYASLAEQIELYHVFFETIGLQKGEKVAICARSCARWGICFLAVNTYGAVVVPILADFTPESAAVLVNHSESVLLVTDPDIWERMKGIKFPKLLGVMSCRNEELLYNSDKAVDAAWNGRRQLFEARYPDGFRPEDVSYSGEWEDRLAIINYTSGSTGDPKGVMLPYKAMSDIVEQCQQIILNEPDSLVSTLPMAHMYGLAMEFIYPCCTGFTIHFLGKVPSPSLFMEALQTVRPRLIITVPLVMEKIYQAMVEPMLASQPFRMPGFNSFYYKSVGKRVEKALGGRVQTIIIGGAPLNWDIECAFRKIGLPYVVGYGMTEACPLIALAMPGQFVAGSCGKPIHEVRIDSSDPETIPGEIQTKGPNLCIGYLKNDAANAKALTHDGWFRTGDLGTLDSGGNLFIRGRIKALILSASGQNIYPEEIEQYLDSQPAVTESVVLDRDGKIIALVYPNPAGVQDPDRLGEQIREAANQRLPQYSHISKVELVDMPLERTAKGTIKRHLYH